MPDDWVIEPGGLLGSLDFLIQLEGPKPKLTQAERTQKIQRYDERARSRVPFVHAQLRLEGIEPTAENIAAVIPR
jgi:hypothetical protein